jgi:hypothetical protein
LRIVIRSLASKIYLSGHPAGERARDQRSAWISQSETGMKVLKETANLLLSA